MTTSEAALRSLAEAKRSKRRRETEQDEADQVLVTKSDLLGIFGMVVFGKGVYGRLLLALGLIVTGAASVMVAARVLGRLVETVVASPSEARILQLGVIYLALETLAVAVQYFGRVGLARCTVEIAYNIRRELFGKLRTLPIAYFDCQPLGRTITRLTHDVEGIETFFSGTLARCLTALITIVTVLVAMVATDVRFGGLMVLASLPSLIFSVALRKPVRDWMRTYKRRSAHVNAKLAEYLGGLPVIRAFGLEDWTKKQFDEATDGVLEAGLMSMNWNSFIRPVTVFLCSLPTLLILWLGGDRVLDGVMALGTLVAFVRFSERFIAPIRTISQEIQNIQEALVSSERVRRMLSEPDELATLGPNGTLRPTLHGAVAYCDVWMGYADGQTTLRGIDFAVQPGMKVGLVGATGSGKTTTVNLLPRLYPFNRGDILLDGISIKDIDREHLRGQLGYVSQDVVIFSGSLRDNLAATLDRDVSDAELLRACQQTGLDQVLAHLPRGLDHRIIEGGENLSMGERQLVAFTRMLLRNPQILILDEATANIDERCELLIQDAIARVMEGRTCFVVAHRLSTIVQCDLILVYDKGQIVEQGTHATLLAVGGYYAELAGRQLLA